MMPDKFDISDYVPVNERIEAFKKDWPEGSLQSSIVELTETRVTVKAFAYRTADDARPGIGHSSVVIPGSTPYTRGSEIENAETSAWGRAIAALGFEVKRGLASREEVRNKSGQGDGPSRTADVAPADPAPAPVLNPGVDQPASPVVMAKKRYEWAALRGWSADALEQAAQDATNHGVGTMDIETWRAFAVEIVQSGPNEQGTGGGAAPGAEAAVDSPPAAPPTSKKGRTVEEAIADAERKAAAVA